MSHPNPAIAVTPFMWCDNRVGNNGNKVGNFRLRGKPGTIKITRFINNLTDHHRTLVHSVSVIFSLKVTNFIFYSGFLSAERCGPESHFVTNFITIPHFIARPIIIPATLLRHQLLVW